MEALHEDATGKDRILHPRSLPLSKQRSCLAGPVIQRIVARWPITDLSLELGWDEEADSAVARSGDET